MDIHTTTERVLIRRHNITEPSAMTPYNTKSLLSSMTPFGAKSSSDSSKTTASKKRLGKRSRASPEQLQILESTFVLNKSPDNKHRKNLSDLLRMSERSIQVWFQNRRAKEKMMQKRNQKMIDAAFLQRKNFQPFPNIPHPLSPSHLNFSTPSMLAYQSNQNWMTDNYNSSLPFTSQDRSVVQASEPKLFSTMSYVQRLTPPISSPTSTNSSFSLSVGSPSTHEVLRTIDPTQLNVPSPAIEFWPESISIGEWHQSIDRARNITIHCGYYPDMRAFEWCIQDSKNCFKIVVHSIDYINYREISRSADLRINFNKIPVFYTKKIVDQEWRPCKDFTEGNEASKVFAHTLLDCHIYETKQALYLIQSLDPTLSILMDQTNATPEPFQVPYIEDIISY